MVLLKTVEQERKELNVVEAGSDGVVISDILYRRYLNAWREYEKVESELLRAIEDARLEQKKAKAREGKE